VVSLSRVFLGSLDVRAAARPSMQAMAEEVGASVYLAIRDGMEMVLIEACRPRSSARSSRAGMPTSRVRRAPTPKRSSSGRSRNCRKWE